MKLLTVLALATLLALAAIDPTLTTHWMGGYCETDTECELMHGGDR